MERAQPESQEPSVARGVRFHRGERQGWVRAKWESCECVSRRVDSPRTNVDAHEPSGLADSGKKASTTTATLPNVGMAASIGTPE
jgi:hypothetical protein